MNENLDTPRERAGFACRRWLARMVDFSVSNVLYVFLVSSLVQFGVIANTGNHIGMVMFPLAFYMLLDTVLLATLKTTLGRSLSCLMLENIQGGDLSFSQILKRNLKVWVFGYWCGILTPILMAIPFLIQYFRVKKHGYASYDRGGVIRVVPLTYKNWRVAASVILMGLCALFANQIGHCFPRVIVASQEDLELRRALNTSFERWHDQSIAYKDGIEESGVWDLLGDTNGLWYVDREHAAENRRRIEDAKSVAKTTLEMADAELEAYGNCRADSQRVKSLLNAHRELNTWWQKRCRTFLDICEHAKTLHILLLKVSGANGLVSPQDRTVLLKFKRELESKDIGFLEAQANQLESRIVDYVRLGQDAIGKASEP